MRGAATRSGRRAALLLGASIASLAMSAPALAQSVSVLRGAAGLAAPTVPLPMPAAANAPVLTAGQMSASARALANQARAQSALNLAQQAQAAARASVPQSAVPNGLMLGGLMPVANPVVASADPTGLNTWQGAALPTQATGSDGKIEVTVRQDASRAILSWQTFNVGQNTSLTFDQSVNGVDQRGWTVLNRVVGQIDPVTGRRDPAQVPAPSQILGAIKAPGTVLVLNQNGVLFGAGAQVDTGSLIVSSLEIGRSRALFGTQLQPLTIAQRNAEFLNFGLLGFADQASAQEQSSVFTFSPVALNSIDDDPVTEGTITIDAGARITSAEAGYVMALAPKVVNHGELAASDGQVSLQSGRRFLLQRSEGTATSLDPNVRGLVVTSQSRAGDEADYVLNDGLIESPHGYLSLGATRDGAVFNNGVLSSTTSVARNGFISLTGATIDVGDASTLWITADTGTETIPQSMDSIDAFKTSQIVIGDDLSNIRIGGGSLLLAPSANVQIGAAAGGTSDIVGDDTTARVFVDSGATFDVSGMKNVEIPASRNQIQISPVKGNELRDTPTYRSSFLNGATVYVDPRLSGVRSDGVRWVGSPLIEAESYYQQVGISAAELMTKGGNISLGTSNWSGSLPGRTPDVIVKQGAVFDISGGWVDYAAGLVQTSRLVTSSGEIVDIGSADPNGEYIGIVGGFTEVQARWGMVTTYANPLLTGEHVADAYTEGRDAGALTIKGSAIAFDGTIDAQSFAGAQQLASGAAGTVTGSVYGDRRALQAVPSQLPAAGYLNIQALAQGAVAGTTAGGGDIEVETGADATPLASDFGFGATATIDGDGKLVEPVRDFASLLPPSRRNVIGLSADMLEAAGLGQLNLLTSGKLTVDAGVSLDLAPGGAFVAAAGRAIHVAGSISTPGGAIDLQTYEISDGNPYTGDREQPGAFDVVIDGTLSTRGRWANDFGVSNASALAGRGFTDGGSIRIAAAPRVSLPGGGEPETSLDISGSILVNAGAMLDVSGGGYVAADGTIDTSAKGGNLTLVEDTTYFQLSPTPVPGAESPGNVPGFRVPNNPAPEDARNPAVINARVYLAPGTIRAFGFQGGGSFSLTTPAIQFGDGPVTTGTALPLDFFSKAGFGSYAITSYATDLVANEFVTKYHGYNAILATQTLDIGAGQTLALTQTRYQPLLDDAQTTALQSLTTGGSLASVLAPSIAPDAADRLGVSLTFGGLTELHVASGGAIQGDAGSSLTASKLWNEGTIRLVGGTLAQQEALPLLYGDAYAARRYQDFFTYRPNGKILKNDPNALGITDDQGNVLTNAELAVQPLYLLGALAADEGVRLSEGSVTDLSGAAIRDPRAPFSPADPSVQLVQGRVVAGGTLSTAAQYISPGNIFSRPEFGEGVYRNTQISLAGTRPGLILNAAPGSVIDLSGASDTFAQLDSSNHYVDLNVWSDGGTLALGAAARLTGADIRAQGGAPEAFGGTFEMLDPVLVAETPPIAGPGVISAAAIEAAGFDTFVARGTLYGRGDVSLSLGRGFFLESPEFDGDATNLSRYVPSLSNSGSLTIDAPYVRLAGLLQNMSSPDDAGRLLNGSITFNAAEIDIAGAVRVDHTVHTLNLNASGDLRLIGAQPYQVTLGLNASDVPNSLLGQLVVDGDLNITAAQVYPTTGSSFLVASAGEDATITIGRSAGSAAAIPYSAGGDLLIQAANIVQAGTLRVPIGSLTLGSTSALKSGSTFAPGDPGTLFAPATASVTLADGSITSVSADGLSIPYGTTTDQIEYYFTPTGAAPLTAPPAALLHLGGASVTLASGATVDLTGGGDLYAYEFVPGTGGSRDVLDRFNTDPFSSNNGFQYPGGRQVYAIVPGLSNAAAAAYDPVYSADYGDLYGSAGAGRSVYLSSAPGLAAGWYTLLPAKYALLPGGLRVVEQTGTPAVLGQSTVLRDGTILTSGYFGDGAAGLRESSLTSFSIQPQSVFRTYSNIVTTSANTQFAAAAEKAGIVTPRLPIDAGRLILEPVDQLILQTSLQSAAAAGGRGALVDIAGTAFDIVSTPPETPQAGVVTLTADGLSGLNAQSLLIGGIRTENADGTTSLDLTASSILVENDAAHVLRAPELLLGVAGDGASLTLADGAVVTATGTLSDTNAANYMLGDGESALLRVANGPARLVTRGDDAGRGDGPPATLTVGASSLSGTSILVDSSGSASIAPNAQFAAQSLALGAANVRFASVVTDPDALTITPELAAAIRGSSLTIRTPNAILFDPGTYGFGALALDTPGLATSSSGGSVAITSGGLTLANGSGATIGCDALGGCNGGALSLSASTLDFGSGTLFTGGFVGGTGITTTGGITYSGQGGLDAGDGSLTLATPFVADATFVSVPDQTTLLPKLSLTSTGAVSITGAAGTTPGSGTPGAVLAIKGGSIMVDGSLLRATAGALSLDAPGDIAVSGGARLETPGYAKLFGDATDGILISAPGGLLRLTSLAGGISLDATSTLSVGGGIGRAGTLVLQAQTGLLRLDGAIDATSTDGGGSLVVDTAGAFDLSRFAGTPNGFTGDLSISTGAGDLSLGAGQSLRADDVLLAADGGSVVVAGTIDTSGTSGGDVALYGRTGVTLSGTALIDAHADGYGATDSRQSSGGNVTLGTDGAGLLSVASGATIDVGARRTGARLVALARNGETFYSYVAADEGGTVRFRAPLIGSGDSGTVNLAYAGAILGARSVAVEAFRRWDLGGIASNPTFTGVTIDGNGQAVLDTGASADGRLNFLSDMGSGTIPDFVQNFVLTDPNDRFASLRKVAGFIAQPGIELDYSGDVELASNWNLGAGTVDIPAAVAAGDMRASDALPGEYVVVQGREGDLLQNYTTMLYRVGGKIGGAPGSLTVRAGGKLTVNGSISDGTFTFADQTDSAYLQTVLGGDNSVYAPLYSVSCDPVKCTDVPDFTGGLQFQSINVDLSKLATFHVSGGVVPPTPLPDDVPYSAAKNTAAAAGGGDPFGSAQLFPLLADGSSVDSWGYRLTAGAKLNGGTPAVDPKATLVSSAAAFALTGQTDYTYSGASASYGGDVLIQALSAKIRVELDQFLEGIREIYPDTSGNANTIVDFSRAPKIIEQFLQKRTLEFFGKLSPSQYVLVGNPKAPTGVKAAASTQEAFFASFEDDLAALIADPSSGLPPPGKSSPPVSTSVRNFIRTGTGTIEVAAAGDIDLTNGDLAYANTNGAPSSINKGYQLGGTAIYTLGHLVAPATMVVGDSTAGTFTLDPAPYLPGSNRQAELAGFTYGTGSQSDLRGILVADPVYLAGGGDVSLKAGGSVLGRRDVQEEAQAAASAFGYDFIGAFDQPWRVGIVGDVTNLRVNPSLFRSGVATLGGGSLRIEAGGGVSDLTAVALTSATTADVTSGSGAAPTLALVTFGGGDLDITAGGSIAGGRFDVGSGDARIVAGGDITAGPVLVNVVGGSSTDNGIRLRLADATVAMSAGGDLALQGIAALGALQPATNFTGNLDGSGFYSATSGVDLLANGAITIANRGSDVVVGRSTATATNTAVYPATVTAAGLTGDINLTPDRDANSAVIELIPSATGNLQLLAGGNMAPVTIQLDDRDPGQIPGLFSVFAALPGTGVTAGQSFGYFGVLPDLSTAGRAALHNASLTHLGDEVPVRIAAGGDILDMILSTSKQTRVSAGRDIIDMMFSGQNLASTDVTRIVAGRDIIGTTKLTRPQLAGGEFGDPEPALQGNSFTIGGPGSFILEAGRDAGPFLNSAVSDPQRPGKNGIGFGGALSFGGGVLSVGNENNPYLPETGADIAVLFGVAKGADFAALRETYLDPANLAAAPDYLFVQVADANGNLSADRNQPIYGPILIGWMKANAAAELQAAFGTTDVSFQQAYDAFAALPLLRQRPFLTNDVYFNELQQTSVPTSVSYLKYSRGYEAVNTLFPASLGYTANSLDGGLAGAASTIETGSLDLRLATIQTSRGGSISLLGPGGRILAGSTVSTAQQAARRTYDGARLLAGDRQVAYLSNGNPATGFSQIAPASVQSIPTGYEGILTLRGGAIYSFTDTDLLLNQSRLFTEDGGNIVLWSSNGDLNAGQGPKTSANFPPVVVRIDANGVSQVDAVGGVSGAGIAGFQPSAGITPPDVFLIAPRGTVDAGDAGVRVAGDLFVAAAQVANSDNFKVGGSSFGIVTAPVVDAGTAAAASAASAAAQQAAVAAAQNKPTGDALSRITVDVQGYAGSDDPCARPGPKPASCGPTK